jgi:hypothetical protein
MIYHTYTKKNLTKCVAPNVTDGTRSGRMAQDLYLKKEARNMLMVRENFSYVGLENRVVVVMREGFVSEALTPSESYSVDIATHFDWGFDCHKAYVLSVSILSHFLSSTSFTEVSPEDVPEELVELFKRDFIMVLTPSVVWSISANVIAEWLTIVKGIGVDASDMKYGGLCGNLEIYETTDGQMGALVSFGNRYGNGYLVRR